MTEKKHENDLARVGDPPLVEQGDLPRPATSQFDLPSAIPCWRCKTCGCCWRDNLDNTVSLWNAAARSCDVCEHGATKEVCAIYWIAVDAEQEQRVIALTQVVSALIATWRERQADLSKARASAYGRCADELQAALKETQR